MKTKINEKLMTLAKEFLTIPTAPYRESAIADYIISFCKERKIRVKQDDVGNLIVTYGPAYKNPALAFAAHMDHPGFIIEKESIRKRTTAWFYGGVEEKYFKGSKVKIVTSNGPVKATVTKTQFDKPNRRRRCWLRLDADVQKGDTAMWDLPACQIRGGRLYSRACDDLVGCLSILALLDELYQRNIRKKVLAVFTVAEESGFQGAKHLCINKAIPKSAYMIAIETSAQRPSAPMGDGVVIRVGDRTSIFTPGMTDFLTSMAEAQKSQEKTFRYQRKLMDGGTCESTIYSRYGYTNGAVCIPLGNYHNRNTKTEKIAPEFVSLSDLENMVILFLAAVKRSGDVTKFCKIPTPNYKKQKGKLGEFFYW